MKQTKQPLFKNYDEFNKRLLKDLVLMNIPKTEEEYQEMIAFIKGFFKKLKKMNNYEEIIF